MKRPRVQQRMRRTRVDFAPQGNLHRKEVLGPTIRMTAAPVLRGLTGPTVRQQRAVPASLENSRQVPGTTRQGTVSRVRVAVGVEHQLLRCSAATWCTRLERPPPRLALSLAPALVQRAAAGALRGRLHFPWETTVLAIASIAPRELTAKLPLHHFRIRLLSVRFVPLASFATAVKV